jgi:hypothetical protein
MKNPKEDSMILCIFICLLQLFSRNLKTQQVKEEEESDQDKLDLEATELLREEQGRVSIDAA